MSMGIIAGVIGAGAAVYGIISSNTQKKRAEREIRKLKDSTPYESTPAELIKNQESAKLMAKTGIPSEQYSLAMKNIQRQQAQTLKSASDRRMGLGLLATVDDNANRATANLDAANANARIQNERNLMGVNNQVANWKTGAYDRNTRQPWNREYDYQMGVLGSANQNKANAINSGINLVGTSLMSYGGGGNSSWAAGLFGNSGRRRNGGYGVGGDANGGNLRLDEYGNLIN